MVMGKEMETARATSEKGSKGVVEVGEAEVVEGGGIEKAVREQVQRVMVEYSM